MQRAPQRIGQRASHTHRIIFLKTRDGVAHLVGKDAVNRPAIVSQPAQIPLQRADISRLHYQLLIRFEVIDPTPLISPVKISGAHRGHLVKHPMLVARRQRIDGIIGKNFFVQDEPASADAREKHCNKCNPDSFHQRIPTSLADGTSGGGSCFPSPRFGQSGQSSFSNSGPKWLRSSLLCRRRYKSSLVNETSGRIKTISSVRSRIFVVLRKSEPTSGNRLKYGIPFLLKFLVSVINPPRTIVAQFGAETLVRI